MASVKVGVEIVRLRIFLRVEDQSLRIRSFRSPIRPGLKSGLRYILASGGKFSLHLVHSLDRGRGEATVGPHRSKEGLETTGNKSSNDSMSC
ncbi:hypothetical protein TNCV_2614761 [Trichonephila clavipes]|nr:hypothetical protein TNCV_2614761 [Trichonephila clavipes]